MARREPPRALGRALVADVRDDHCLIESTHATVGAVHRHAINKGSLGGNANKELI